MPTADARRCTLPDVKEHTVICEDFLSILELAIRLYKETPSTAPTVSTEEWTRSFRYDAFKVARVILITHETVLENYMSFIEV